MRAQRARRSAAAAAERSDLRVADLQERLADAYVREHDYVSAAVHYRTALRHLGNQERAAREAPLFEKLGRALFSGPAPLDAAPWTRRAYRRYLHDRADRGAAARSSLALAEVLWLGAQTRRSIPLLRRAVDLAGAERDSSLWALSKLLLAASLRIVAQHGEADAHVDDVATLSGSHEATAAMYLFDQRAIGEAEAGRTSRALELFEDAVAAAARGEDAYPVTVALDDFAFYAAAFAGLDVAQRYRERALSLARSQRLGWRTTYLGLRLALHYTVAGDPARAVRFLRDATPAVFDPGAPPVLRILFYSAGIPTAIALGDRSLLAVGEATGGLELAFASAEEDRIAPAAAAAIALHRHRDDIQLARAVARRALPLVHGPVHRTEIQRSASGLGLRAGVSAAPQAATLRRRFGTVLTQRQIDVAELLASDATNRMIAATLRISEHTVESHVSAILARLDLKSRWELRA